MNHLSFLLLVLALPSRSATQLPPRSHPPNEFASSPFLDSRLSTSATHRARGLAHIRHGFYYNLTLGYLQSVDDRARAKFRQQQIRGIAMLSGLMEKPYGVEERCAGNGQLFA